MLLESSLNVRFRDTIPEPSHWNPLEPCEPIPLMADRSARILLGPLPRLQALVFPLWGCVGARLNLPAVSRRVPVLPPISGFHFRNAKSPTSGMCPVELVYTVYIRKDAMKTQLSKWGNSLAVRIPKPVAAAAKLRTGDNLDVAVDGHGQVRIRKSKRKLSLAELVSAITPDNRHSEQDWGGPEGKELW
jgi:antitoxin MazE